MLHTLLSAGNVRRHRLQAEERRRQLRSVERPDWPGRQFDLLQRAWQDAVTDVPFYSALVSAGRAPDRITSWADLRSIPPLTRQHLQEQPQSFRRRTRPADSIMTTAGSTGTPLRMGLDQRERDLMRVVKLSEWQALGYQPGSRLFLIWGHSHLLGTGWRGKMNHVKRLGTDALLGYRRADAYRLNRQWCEAYAEELIQFQPIGLIGYASALDLFARYTTAFRDRFRQLAMRFVLSTSEAPPRPDTIDVLSDLFACPVVQEYGGAEFGQVAFKHHDTDFEVYPDLNYVEAETSGASSAPEAPLLVTSLYRRYVPLFRYRVGDTVTGAKLLANGHVDKFAAVGGRVNDVIDMGDGEAVHSVAIMHCIHQEPAVYNIQMALHDTYTEIRLISAETDRAAMEARITARLAQVHPALAAVRFTYVEDLESNRAGKRRWFVDYRTASPCAASPES
ncbi:MAG TPA: hypothetical protein VEA16_19025 [Vicinamibacterales bacterium]|nr:hypothetical protein [Vicinamibacterales bacterium]